MESKSSLKHIRQTPVDVSTRKVTFGPSEEVYFFRNSETSELFKEDEIEILLASQDTDYTYDDKWGSMETGLQFVERDLIAACS